MFVKYFLIIFFVFFNIFCVISFDNNLFGKCVNLFDPERFLVREIGTGEGKTTESWFEIKESSFKPGADELKIYEELWGGKFAGHKPCVVEIKNDTTYTVAPLVGYLHDDEFSITCRPKFDLMLWYRGFRSYTVSQRKCKRWDNATYQIPDNDELVTEMHNYCRNPDESPCGPWCFLENTSDMEADIVRQPCFLTCYNEIYVNKSVPCIGNTSWPSAKNVNPIYDKMLYMNVAGSSAESCSTKRMSHTDILKLDLYGLQYDPFGWENYPLVGHTPTGPWGYSCYTVQFGLETFEPTRVQCQDLRLLCIPYNVELMNYHYYGNKNFSRSGRECLQWQSVKNDYGNPSWYKKIWRAFFEEKFNTDGYDLKPEDKINRCINPRDLVNAATILSDYDEDLDLGPACFVSSGNKIFMESCFYRCLDFVVDSINCIPAREYQSFSYEGSRSKTLNDGECRKLSSEPLNDKTYCRLHPNHSDLGPSCLTDKSENDDDLKRCFEPCTQNETRDVKVNEYFYSPCTEPKYEHCCQTPKTIPVTKATPIIPETLVTRATVLPTTPKLPFNPIKIPPELETEEGTLTEPGLRPTAIAEIILVIVYVVGCIGLIILFRNNRLEDL